MELLWILVAITAAPPPMAVAIQGFGYKPKLVEITQGTRVVWTNADDIQHTVTALADSGQTPLFNGDLPGKGKSFGFTFDRAGIFVYQCARHSFMRGEIRVTSKGEQ